MDTLKTILASRLIAISRGIYGEELLSASEALYEGGVRAFETALEQDKPMAPCLEAISLLAEKLPADAAVGAGTVLSSEQVRLARNAGARYIISPNTSEEVVRETKRLGLVSIPGAMTPTEILEAYSFGADMVKLFPAGMLGIEYFKAVRAPLRHIPLAAVAGITPQNIREFSDAGAVAFGISSGLYLKDALKTHDYERIRDAALSFYSALNKD